MPWRFVIQGCPTLKPILTLSQTLTLTVTLSMLTLTLKLGVTLVLTVTQVYDFINPCQETSRHLKIVGKCEHSYGFFLLDPFFLLTWGVMCWRISSKFHPATWKCHRPLQRVTCHIKGTRSPCWFQLSPWESVNNPMNFSSAVMVTWP